MVHGSTRCPCSATECMDGCLQPYAVQAVSAPEGPSPNLLQPSGTEHAGLAGPRAHGLRCGSGKNSFYISTAPVNPGPCVRDTSNKKGLFAAKCQSASISLRERGLRPCSRVAGTGEQPCMCMRERLLPGHFTAAAAPCRRPRPSALGLLALRGTLRTHPGVARRAFQINADPTSIISSRS